jgi:hypothetical protein
MPGASPVHCVRWLVAVLKMAALEKSKGGELTGG